MAIDAQYVVVVWLEQDHLVARVEQAQQRRGDRFGAAACDHDVGQGVERDAVVALLLARDGLHQCRVAPRARVLVLARLHRHST